MVIISTVLHTGLQRVCQVLGEGSFFSAVMTTLSLTNDTMVDFHISATVMIREYLASLLLTTVYGPARHNRM